MAMPIFKNKICLTDVLTFFSLSISGKMPTRAIYRKPPLVKGNIQDVRSPARSAVLKDRANTAPDTPAVAVTSYF